MAGAVNALPERLIDQLQLLERTHQPTQFPVGMAPFTQVEILPRQIQRHRAQHELMIVGERQMLLGHGLEPAEQRASTGRHDHPQQRPQAFVEADQLVVLTLRRAYPDLGLLHRGQTLKILDHAVQIDRRRAVAELIAAEGAIVALLVFQPGPLRCLCGTFVIKGTVQLDPVAELMLIVQGDAIFDSH